MADEQVLRIPARPEGMDLVLSFVSYLLDAHGCAPKPRTQLRMAVEELCVNVTLYAYPGGDGWLEVRGGVEGGVATLVVADAGTPFDPLAKPDPDVTLPGEERGIGGLGIYMVKSMVDELEYARVDGRNQLTLRKRI